MTRSVAVFAERFADPKPISTYVSQTSSSLSTYSHSRVTNPTHVTGGYTEHEIKRSRELGISVHEYRSRVNRVYHLHKDYPRTVGQLVRPANAEDFEEHGYMRVRAKAETYDAFAAGKSEWSECPFLIAVYPLNNTNTTIMCSVNWVVPVVDDYVINSGVC